MEGRVAWIQFRHPPLNIFTMTFLKTLLRDIERVSRHPHLTAVVFTSGLPKAFSAGVAIQDHYPPQVPRLFKTFHAVFRRLWSWHKLSVAEVDGYCLGGGAELALACDLVVASSRAQFGFPEITVGCFPPIGVVRLPSPGRFPMAVEWILSGKRFTAQEAFRQGLLNRVVPPSRLRQTTRALLTPILKQSPLVLKKTLQVMRIHTKRLIPYIERSERLYLKELLPTHDAMEGLNAFLGKRAPQWKNR